MPAEPEALPTLQGEVRVRATERWRSMVEAEHAQSDRMRREAPPSDHWTPYAQNFRADPRRSGDVLLDRLLQEGERGDAVIDVGAGGGRLALPLALHCRRVVAVEPSDSMASVLLDQAGEYGVANISLVRESWEEAVVEPAEIVLCCHVLYTVRDVAPFVRKLDSHALRKVLVVLYHAPPQSQNSPLWARVHGEERLPLPSAPQLVPVLSELGIDASFERLAPQPPRGFDSLDDAIDQLSRRLYLAPGAEKEGLLREILPGLLVEEEDGFFRLRGAERLVPVLVSWRPGK
jgi:2-polyprenyl-3-methyl-5-hydroxy-6-metoxy-1,4-benzoquinol methylase